MFNKKIKKSQNKYIQNASPKLYNGVKYKSQLEAFTAESLDTEQIKFEYEKNSFLLQDKFESINSSIEVVKSKKTSGFILSRNNIRTIKYTPDFMDPQFRWLIETKGYRTAEFDIKWKMFKKYLTDNNLKVDLYLPQNQGQVKKCIEIIKEKYK